MILSRSLFLVMVILTLGAATATAYLLHLLSAL